MTFKEYLISKGITEEQAATVIEGMPEEKFYLAGEEKLDERYAKLKVQKEQLEEQIATNQKELDGLKESVSGNEDLTKKLGELQESFDASKAEYESKLSAYQKEYAIKLALKDSHTLDDGLVYGLLDTESINVTDGGLLGLKDQLERIQNDKPFLFQKDGDPVTEIQTPQIVASGNPVGNDPDPTDPFAAKLAKYE